MSDVGARIVSVFGRSLSSAVIVLFGYLSWYAFRGRACDSREGLCEAGRRLGDILYSPSTLLSQASIAVCILGAGYIVGLLHQLVFDETLRRNYDAFYARILKFRLDRALVEYRDQTVRELSQKPFVAAAKHGLDDHLLYEIVCAIYDPNTRSYVDTARVLGASTLTLVAVLWLDCVAWAQFTPTHLAILAAATLLILFVGREAIKAQFRYRAIRLYISYLLGLRKQPPA
jgi:hypothetical protein